MPYKVPRQASISLPSYDPSDRVKSLAEYGSQVEIDRTLAVKLYFRSGREMLRMANMYCDDNQLESAFILYYKFITLFLEKLPTHPDFKNAPQDQVLEYKRKVKKVFPLAEEIKKKLKERYAIEEKVYLAEQKKIAEEKAAEEERRLKAIAEQEKQDEELARKLQEEQEAELRNSQEEKYRILKIQEEEKVKKEEERKDQGGGTAVAAGDGIAVAGAAIAAIGGAPGNSLFPDPSSFTSPQVPNSVSASADNVPAPPPSYSQYLQDISSSRPEIPDRELKNKLVLDDHGSPLTIQSSIPEATSHVPSIDRTTKPSIDHHLSLGGFGLEKGDLRQVIVPSVLMIKFLAAAERNTLKEAETMGILCGILTQGVFKITHLFIPKQTGGHDSCDMENEEEVLFFQDEHNLITLGWIHTHPTQTAFLSSVDLHSHFPWQKMMPEAVAIVCSPKYQETGIFKLTDRGLDVIGSCQQKGFHPHAKDPPLFETCGHVRVTDTDGIQVEDKRIS